MYRSLDGGATTVVTQNGVTIERGVDEREDGIILTMELSSDVRGPVVVELVDEFPADLPVAQVGFNVDYEPEDGAVSIDRVELSHTIEGGPARIVYAIRLAEPVENVEFDPPTILDVTIPGVPEKSQPVVGSADEDDGDDAAQGEPGTGDEPTTGEASADGASADGTSADGASADGTSANGTATAARIDETVEAGAEDGSGEFPDGLSLPGDESSDAEPGGTSTESRSASAESDAGAADEAETAIGDGGADSSRIESAIESAIEHTELEDSNGTTGAADVTVDGTYGTGGDASRNGDRPRVATDDGASRSGEGLDAASRRPHGNGTPARPASQSPDGSPQPDASGRAGDIGPEEIPRSVQLRLDRLNARVEEFAAYAEALEGIIERHGTAPEILEEIESDLSAADERLEDVREEVHSLESRHAADVEAYDDRLESLESRLEGSRQALESEVDDVGAVDEVREDVADVSREVDALGDRLDDHETDVEHLDETVDRVASEVTDVSRNVEAMRSEMESLQADVDRLL